MKEFYRGGERVMSTLCGWYYGAKGRIIGVAQVQYDSERRYIIELDSGQTISLPARCIKEITDEDLDEEDEF